VRKVAEPRSTPPPTNKQAKCDGGVGKDACCSSDNKCGLGEGDCDGNADCQGDLVCREGLNNCRLFNPNAKADADCCIPGWMYQFASGVSVKSHSSNRVVLNTPRTMADCLYLYIACTDYQEPGWPGNKDKCMEICKWCPMVSTSTTPPPATTTPPTPPPCQIGFCSDECPCPEDQECRNGTCVKNGPAGLPQLVKISFATESCIGCEDQQNTDEGLIIKLVGEESGGRYTGCTSNTLDHKERDDYKNGTLAVFQVDKNNDLKDKRELGDCYEAPMSSCLIPSILAENTEGEKSTITWSANQGTWTPRAQRIDFVMIPRADCSDPVSCCISQPSLRPGDNSANLVDCEKIKNGKRKKTADGECLKKYPS